MHDTSWRTGNLRLGWHAFPCALELLEPVSITDPCDRQTTLDSVLRNPRKLLNAVSLGNYEINSASSRFAFQHG